MHLAAAQCSLRGIGLLLANGASVNASDHRGRTPLHVACASCHIKSLGGGDSDIALLECIELLLSSGALEDARDAKGQTALHLSALAGNLSAARVLLAAGAKVVADDAGNSPLHLAAAQGHSDIIQLLVVGNRDEALRKPRDSVLSEFETRAQRRPPTAVREIHPVVNLSANQKGTRTVSVGRHEGSSTITDGEAFGGDDVAARTAAAPTQHFGATDNPDKVPAEHAEGIVCSREAQPRHDESGGLSLKDGTSTSVDNGHSWGGPSSLNSVPDGQNRSLAQRNVHASLEPRWQGQADSHSGLVEKSTRNADRTSGDDAGGRRDHQAVETEHRRRRLRGGKSRLSQNRHESARDGRTLSWPDALTSNEYEQVNGSYRGSADGVKYSQVKSNHMRGFFATSIEPTW